LSIKNTNLGVIYFAPNITQSSDNLSSDIQIAHNFVFVNSTQTGLNQSADVTFYGLGTGTNRTIYRDGIVCPGGICSPVGDLNGDTAQFQVTGWSNYTLEEFVPGPGPNS